MTVIFELRLIMGVKNDRTIFLPKFSPFAKPISRFSAGGPKFTVQFGQRKKLMKPNEASGGSTWTVLDSHFGLLPVIDFAGKNADEFNEKRRAFCQTTASVSSFRFNFSRQSAVSKSPHPAEDPDAERIERKRGQSHLARCIGRDLLESSAHFNRSHKRRV